MALAAHAGDRGAARGTSEDGGKARRPAIRRKAQGLSPPSHCAVGGPACEEEIVVREEKLKWLAPGSEDTE